MTPRASTRSEGRAIALDRIALAFGDGRALADISLSVRAGERLAIVGPSGVGKTTLLRAIAGLASTQAGTIHVGGRDVTALPPERRGVVYLHQTPVLFAHLDVAENVAFPLRVRGERAAAMKERVRASLEPMRLTGFERRATRSLSGGQRHRVALARAIAARPGALLLDEPLSALDPSLRDDVRSAIVAAQEEYGPSMMLVTHDLDDAGLLADRIAVLLDGGVAQVDTPGALFSRPASLAVGRFLGLYEEVGGRVLEDGRIRCALGELPASTPGPVRRAGDQVVVMVRAEGIRVGPPAENGSRGEIVAVRQRARAASVVVRLDHDAEKVDVEAVIKDQRERPRIGDPVSVTVVPCQALAFPA